MDFDQNQEFGHFGKVTPPQRGRIPEIPIAVCFGAENPLFFFRGKIASKCRNFPNFPENDPCLRVWVHILRKFKSLNFCPFFRICPTTSRDWLGNATKRPLGRKKTSQKCRTFFAFLFRNFGKNAPELGNSLIPASSTHSLHSENKVKGDKCKTPLRRRH